MAKKNPAITHDEVGQLKSIHTLIATLATRTDNVALAKRLWKAFAVLPLSTTNGLNE